MSKTAERIDSYSDTLLALLAEFKPRNVFEWGPGNSTDLIASFPTVFWVDTVEDSEAWFNHYYGRKPYNVKLYLEPDLEKYPYVKGRLGEYDLVFIDGVVREKCLEEAKKLIDDGIVILHDAERKQYRNAIDSYPYYIFTDNGHTCVLTKDEYVFVRIKKILCV